MRRLTFPSETSDIILDKTICHCGRKCFEAARTVEPGDDGGAAVRVGNAGPIFLRPGG